MSRSSEALSRGGMSATGALAVIAALAAWPLLVPRLPHGTDTLFHLYTLVQLEHLADSGIWWSRWFPYQAAGFGLPLFVFYPPLASYLGLALTMVGLSPVAAIRGVMGLAFLAGASGMYFWSRRTLPWGSALLAAALFSLSPYLLYNAYFRGGLAEHVALAVVPWLFATVAMAADRDGIRSEASRLPRLRAVAALGLTTALLVTAHLLTAAVVLPAAGLYGLVLAWTSGGRRGSRWVVAGLALGLALSCFYWLPAAWEKSAIRDTLAATPDLDFQRNFVSFRGLFTAPWSAPTTASLSALATILALAGLLWQWRQTQRSPGDRVVPLFGVAICLGAALMAGSLSRPLWEALPTLRFFQFPQRFLAVALPWLAWLAAHGLTRLSGRRALIVATLALAALPAATLRHAGHYPPLPEIDVAFVMEKERSAGQIGTLYIGHFVPQTVAALPPRDRLANRGSDRLNRSRRPAGVRILEQRFEPLRYELTVDSATPWRAAFETFHYAGWRGRIDGMPAEVFPDPPHGTLAMAVPAGRRRLEVWFGSTPLRRGAGTVSLLAAIVTWALVWRGRR